MSITQRICDMCSNPIEGDEYYVIVFEDHAAPDDIKPSVYDTCPTCESMLRSYMRHGLPKISRIIPEN